MGRVVASEVKQIIDTDISDVDIGIFIESANALVSGVIGSDTTLSDTQKKSIELWLSAHLMASSRERQPTKEKAGKAEVSYQGITEKGLNSTLYGQQALLLDTTGKMSKISKKSVTILAITSFE